MQNKEMVMAYDTYFHSCFGFMCNAGNKTHRSPIASLPMYLGIK